MSPFAAAAAWNWLPPSRRSRPPRPLIYGRLQLTRAEISMRPPADPPACIASLRRGNPPPSSSPRSCRCRRWRWTRTAFSMPPPIRTGRCIASSIWPARAAAKGKEPATIKACQRILRLGIFRSRDEIHLGPGFRQCRQPVCRHRRSWRNLSGDSQGRAFRIFQKR